MSNTKMFVPEKIKVGYQKRDDTYTKKLAYVIYFDNKWVLRKEKSWEGWRDKKIKAQEFSNEPMEGFVLNRGGGGARESYSSWDTRNEFIRVYDPRDFEFEISVANLLFILQECSAIKGKGLEGSFVYAWNGTELVLLPVDSAEYVACTEHTARQSKKLVAKEVKAGFSYVMKNGTNVLYLGKYPYSTTDSWKGFTPIGNRHIFLNLDDPNPKYGSPHIIDTGFSRLAEAVSPAALPTYPDELDRFKKSKYYGEIVGFKLVPMEIPAEDHLYGNFLISDNDVYYIVYIRRSWQYGGVGRAGFGMKKSAAFVPELKDNRVVLPPINGDERSTGLDLIKKFKFFKLVVKTPAGTKIDIRI